VCKDLARAAAAAHRRAAPGEEVIRARGGKPVAKLVPIRAARRRRLGQLSFVYAEPMRARLPRLLALLAIGCHAPEPIAVRSTATATPARAEPEPAGDDVQRTELALPCSGTWIVNQGYNGAETHRGYAAYALDLVALDARGRAYRGRGRRRGDWFSFGAEVLASADGTVVRVTDRFSDNPIMGRATDVNKVIVEHDARELSEYVHLQHGSVRVRVGERVRRGQVIGRAGNSGAQTPHLHWAFLSSLDPIRTRPAVFARYEVRGDDGAWRSASGVPRAGELVRPPQDAR
jgi:murein DD-endopeptidase MepM/ murein hydrolase activator NlpD